MKVFVCSTYDDLKDERQAVLEAIRMLQEQHDCMEIFGSHPGRPIEHCLAEVQSSDLLVVIVAHRYGSLVPNTDLSFTETEYREGIRHGKPCLVYLRDENVPVLPRNVEHSPKLDNLKKDISSRHTAARFAHASDLAVRVAVDVAREISNLKVLPEVRPCPGQELEPLTLARLIRDSDRLVGLLVLPGYRAWLVAGQAPPETNPEMVDSGVWVAQNQDELYRGKSAQALQCLRDSVNDLRVICRLVGAPMTLLFPAAIDPVTYRRFHGVDQKYVFTSRSLLEQSTYPTMLSTVHIVTATDGTLPVLSAPPEWLKDTFGIEVTQRKFGELSGLVIAETAFKRNAKVLAVCRGTNRLLGGLTVGREQTPHPVTFDPRFDACETLRGYLRDDVKGLSLRTGTPMPKDRGRRRPMAPRHAHGCEHCNGERFVIAECNLRAYRIPCRHCNADHDRSWIYFTEVPNQPFHASAYSRV